MDRASMRAWIIGNGPSLMYTPLGLLKDEITFAVNHIAKIFPYTDWRPTYYARVDEPGDPDLYEDPYWAVVRDMKPIIDEGIYSFLGPYFYSPVSRELNGGIIQGVLPICGDQQWHIWDGPNCVPQKWHMSNRDRITEYCSFGGSLGVAIQIVNFDERFRGCDEIYLVGCDMGFKDGEPNHFVDDYDSHTKDPIPASTVEADKIHAHEIANTCSKIPIMNATIGGSLEVYPRVDIRSLLKCP